MIKPRALEVNAFDRSIGGHYNALASRHLQHGGIVTDALGCFSPLVEKCAHDVEFTTGAKLDIVTVIAVFHLQRWVARRARAARTKAPVRSTPAAKHTAHPRA